MRVGLISTIVPFINGGGRFIVEWLQEKLVERGHEVEIINIPSTDETDHILSQMDAIRTLQLDTHFDRIVTFRPPAHVAQHPKKIVWFIHHIRVLYDLWDTHYRSFPDDDAMRALRAEVIAADTTALKEAYKLFTNSKVVAQRISAFNGLNGEVLYPPILKPEMFRSGPYGDEIVCVCRIEGHKRQLILVEALALTKTPVRLRLCGVSADPAYAEAIQSTAQNLGVADRVDVKNRWISEEEKASFLENALAAAYVPYDEDSYGYPTIEAAHASRCTLTLNDSGGVREFVIDGENGLMVEPNAPAIAAAMDALYADRDLAQRLGARANARITELGIDWDTVIRKLLE